MQVSDGVAADPEPRKPNVVLWDGATAPFQVSFVTTVVAPTIDITPPQAWVTVCPPGQLRTTVQPVVEDGPGFVTVTSPWKPPCHEPVTL